VRASIIWCVLQALGSQASWAQEASVEDRACIIKAAAKLPKITGLAITQSRAVPQGQAQGTTYIFNCIRAANSR